MSKCNSCGGNGVCPTCKGTGSSKGKNTHPSELLIDPETGAVQCINCMGKKYCTTCSGTGKT
jgi:hypothetical protein